MGEVIPFPRGQPEPEAAPEPEPEVEPFDFLSWVCDEVLDFQTSVAGLDSLAEADPDAFWREVDRLWNQIRTWPRP